MYRDMWKNINTKFLFASNPVWEISINNRAKNYVKIFKPALEKNK
jgi:hypothetical protein